MKNKLKKSFLFLCALMVILFPFIRLLLLLFQGINSGGQINGKCLTYNISTGELTACPFAFDCLNSYEKLLIATSFLSPFFGLIYYYYAFIDNPAKELGEAYFYMSLKEGEYKFISDADRLKKFGFSFEFVKEIIRDERQLNLIIEDIVNDV